jgi:hypothetical protein
MVEWSDGPANVINVSDGGEGVRPTHPSNPRWPGVHKLGQLHTWVEFGWGPRGCDTYIQVLTYICSYTPTVRRTVAHLSGLWHIYAEL